MTLIRFEIVSRSDPQALIRLLNHFAQRSMLPGHVTATETGGRLVIRIDQPGMDERQAHIIARKMSNSVLVETVRIYRDAVS